MTDMTADQLRALFHYNPDTGVFTRTADRGKWKAGTPVGSTNTIGYVVINTGRPLYAHRLAFLWMTGDWPKHSVDHVDGNPANNRWSNLRDIPQKANTENIKKAKKQNSSGLLGVTWHAGAGKYMARIHVGHQSLHLGLFTDPEEAHQAYLTAKRLHHIGNTL